MATKKYKVRFLLGYVGSGQTKPSSLFKALGQNIATNNVGPIIDLESHKYQMRQLISVNNDLVFKGAFARLRDDAPNIATESGSEETITLKDDQHLIEKNFFIYYAQHELLVYQTNTAGSDISKLAKYLTTVASGEATVTFLDIHKPEALQDLLNGHLKSVEVAYAKPKNLTNYTTESDWGDNMIKLLTGSGAGRISVKVTTKSKTNYLTTEMKNAVRKLVGDPSIRALKIGLAEAEDPIDLISEVVKDEIEVVMDNLYPNPTSIYSELEKAKDRQRHALNDYLTD